MDIEQLREVEQLRGVLDDMMRIWIRWWRRQYRRRREWKEMGRSERHLCQTDRPSRGIINENTGERVEKGDFSASVLQN